MKNLIIAFLVSLAISVITRLLLSLITEDMFFSGWVGCLTFMETYKYLEQ